VHCRSARGAKNLNPGHAMEALSRVEGIAAPLVRPSIDTDVIIPSREITSPARDGFGEKLFAPWRYLGPSRRENPDFVLNRPAFRQASILIAGENFGCGSSRELAVWALKQFGIRCIIAPSFGAIFRNNCIRNSVLPVQLDGDVIQALGAAAESGTLRLVADLVDCAVVTPDGSRHAFSFEPADRAMLLSGLDGIDVTWPHRAEINDFECKGRTSRPWVWGVS
jgi:3-isopropylmalate/(R)-2-methylmalate dehydratase small subunit